MELDRVRIVAELAGAVKGDVVLMAFSRPCLTPFVSRRRAILPLAKVSTFVVLVRRRISASFGGVPKQFAVSSRKIR